MKNLFDSNDVKETIARINALTSETEPLWGKMKVDQMLAHLSIAYDMTLTNKYPKPNAFARFMIKLFAKSAVVGPKPYPRNGRTAKEFIIDGRRDFEEEKKRLIQNIETVYNMGESAFDGRKSLSFDELSIKEWNTLFAKHLDHHLSQFGV